MRAPVVRLAILAYPRRWRRRYGPELEQLTIAVLSRPQTPARRVGIVLDLIINGADERLRRTESTRVKAAATSMSALLAGMFAFGGGLTADSLAASNVQLSPSVHLGAGVSLVRANQPAPAPGARTGVSVRVPKGRDPLIAIGGDAAVVINTKSGKVTSITRVANHKR
jgi:hypothetical protein